MTRQLQQKKWYLVLTAYSQNVVSKEAHSVNFMLNISMLALAFDTLRYAEVSM